MRNSFWKQIVNFDLSSFENPLLNDRYSVYGEIQLDEFIINNSDGNKYILTHDLEVVETKFVVPNKRTVARYIFGSAFKKLIFFYLPFKCRGICIYIASNDLSPPKLFPIDEVKAKMFALRYAGDYDDKNDYDSDDDEMRRDKTVFIPLIHTLK